MVSGPRGRRLPPCCPRCARPAGGRRPMWRGEPRAGAVRRSRRRDQVGRAPSAVRGPARPRYCAGPRRIRRRSAYPAPRGRTRTRRRCPTSPVSAISAGPRAEESRSPVRTMLAVRAILAKDISGPGELTYGDLGHGPQVGVPGHPLVDHDRGELLADQRGRRTARGPGSSRSGRVVVGRPHHRHLHRWRRARSSGW